MASNKKTESSTKISDMLNTTKELYTSSSTPKNAARQPPKRARSMSTGSPVSGDINYSAEPPDGVNPVLWDMLLSIKSDTTTTNEKLDAVDNRVLVLEDQHDHTGQELHRMKESLAEIIECNRSLVGRLLRAERKIDRQRDEITDLRTRMMRENIIIRSKGAEYKDNRNENTASIFQNFVSKELRVPNSDKINITRAHRMGQSSGEYNRMIIAKVPAEEDHKRIFANVKALKNTSYSISRQYPQEVEERRQFGWPAYKNARATNTPARFDGGRLVVDSNPVNKYDPLPLPPISASVQGIASPMMWGISDVAEESGHTFKAWVTPVKNMYSVRDTFDKLLQNDGAAGANHIPYAFRFKDENGQLVENFESDEDSGMGLHIIKSMRIKEAMDVAIFIAHNKSDCNITMKAKLNCTRHVVAGGLLALINGPADGIINQNLNDTSNADI